MTHRALRLTEFSLLTPERAASLVSGAGDSCGCPGTTGTLADAGEDAALRWEGVIGVEDELTGDGRFIESNALFWDDLPIPLRFAPEDNGGHDGASVVGRILTIERRSGGKVWASGDFDLGSEVGREAARQVEGGYSRGVSMDLDSVAFEVRIAKELIEPEEFDSGEMDEDDDGRVTVFKGSPDDEVMVMTSARIRAATLVSIPAFAGANIDVVETQIADEDSGDDSLATRAASLALVMREPDDLPEDAVCAEEGCDRPAVVEVVDEADAESERVLYCEEHAREAVAESEEDEGDDGEGDEAPAGEEAEEAAGLVAGGGPVAPPRAWFSDPSLTGPTPLTVTSEGHVFGHLAVWNTCHTAYSGQCVEPPHSPSGYAYFHTGSVLTREGDEVGVGAITLDTLHAGADMTPAQTLSHYENTGTAVADVVAGEDAFGIWVSGSLRPGLEEERVRAFRASPLSGDWRRISGSLELVAALAVNVPGFPVPRPSGLVASGVMQTLVASGMLAPRKVIAPGSPGSLTEEDLRYLKRLAAREKRETEESVKTRAEELAASLRSTRAAVLAARIK